MEQLDTFLARHPPFDELDPVELRTVAADADQREYASGQAVLIEDGEPAGGLWVVLTGSMELVHQGEVVQVLEPGECFGHTSLLTGLAPVFTVRAREPSTCAFFGPAAGGRLLGSRAGAAYVAASLRKRLVRAGYTVHGLLDVGTTPVSAIMRPPAYGRPDESLRDVAGRLGVDGVHEVLVELDGGRIGIVADAEVRAALRRGTLDAPLAAVARTPVPTVPVGQLAVEATVEMLARSTEHLVVANGERVCGVLSAADLIALDARSPIALRHRLLAAVDEEALVRAAADLPQLFGLLLRAGVPPPDIGAVLSLQHDAVVVRLIDFSISRHGPAPLAWTWLDLGSAARREFTLGSDQDNALAYATPAAEEEVDAYFARMGGDVNAGLERCGVGIDNNGVMAGRPLWRMSKRDWLKTFGEVLTQPDESHLVRATVAFDFRPAAGGLSVAPELNQYIRSAREHPEFMRLMARTASGFPVALGLRGQLATGRGGDPPDQLDLKRGAIIPLVNLVRFYALSSGVTISPTLDRLEAVAAVGGLERSAAEALTEAFEVITRLRLDHHGARIAAGAAIDNLIDPGELTPIVRSELREALHVVRRAQKRLVGWVPPGR